MRALKPFVPLLLLISLYAGGGFGDVLHAQPRLEVEPDSIFFHDKEPNTREIRLWNGGADYLQIDSLRFSTADPNSWHLEISLPDTFLSLDYHGRLDTNLSAPFSPFLLASLDTAHIEISPLIATGKRAREIVDLPVDDTLWIYSNDSMNSPRLISITGTIELSAEHPGDATEVLSIQAYPNPFHQHITLEIETAQFGPVDVAIYNVLGQQVYSNTITMYPKARQHLRWPERPNTVSKGVYFIRVSNHLSQFTKPVISIN